MDDAPAIDSRLAAAGKQRRFSFRPPPMPPSFRSVGKDTAVGTGISPALPADTGSSMWPGVPKGQTTEGHQTISRQTPPFASNTELPPVPPGILSDAGDIAGVAGPAQGGVSHPRSAANSISLLPAESAFSTECVPILQRVDGSSGALPVKPWDTDDENESLFVSNAGDVPKQAHAGSWPAPEGPGAAAFISSVDSRQNHMDVAGVDRLPDNLPPDARGSVTAPVDMGPPALLAATDGVPYGEDAAGLEGLTEAPRAMVVSPSVEVTGSAASTPVASDDLLPLTTPPAMRGPEHLPAIERYTGTGALRAAPPAPPPPSMPWACPMQDVSTEELPAIWQTSLQGGHPPAPEGPAFQAPVVSGPPAFQVNSVPPGFRAWDAAQVSRSGVGQAAGVDHQQEVQPEKLGVATSAVLSTLSPADLSGEYMLGQQGVMKSSDIAIEGHVTQQTVPSPADGLTAGIHAAQGIHAPVPLASGLAGIRPSAPWTAQDTPSTGNTVDFIPALPVQPPPPQTDLIHASSRTHPHEILAPSFHEPAPFVSPPPPVPPSAAPFVSPPPIPPPSLSPEPSYFPKPTPDTDVTAAVAVHDSIGPPRGDANVIPATEGVADAVWEGPEALLGGLHELLLGQSGKSEFPPYPFPLARPTQAGLKRLAEHWDRVAAEIDRRISPGLCRHGLPPPVDLALQDAFAMLCIVRYVGYLAKEGSRQCRPLPVSAPSGLLLRDMLPAKTPSPPDTHPFELFFRTEMDLAIDLLVTNFRWPEAMSLSALGGSSIQAVARAYAAAPRHWVENSAAPRPEGAPLPLMDDVVCRCLTAIRVLSLCVNGGAEEAIRHLLQSEVVPFGGEMEVLVLALRVVGSGNPKVKSLIESLSGLFEERGLGVVVQLCALVTGSRMDGLGKFPPSPGGIILLGVHEAFLQETIERMESECPPSLSLPAAGAAALGVQLSETLEYQHRTVDETFMYPYLLPWKLEYLSLICSRNAGGAPFAGGPPPDWSQLPPKANLLLLQSFFQAQPSDFYSRSVRRKWEQIRGWLGAAGGATAGAGLEDVSLGSTLAEVAGVSSLLEGVKGSFGDLASVKTKVQDMLTSTGMIMTNNPAKQEPEKEFYYDKTRKRWVIQGEPVEPAVADVPAESAHPRVFAPPPPPPVMPESIAAQPPAMPAATGAPVLMTAPIASPFGGVAGEITGIAPITAAGSGGATGKGRYVNPFSTSKPSG